MVLSLPWQYIYITTYVWYIILIANELFLSIIYSTKIKGLLPNSSKMTSVYSYYSSSTESSSLDYIVIWISKINPTLQDLSNTYQQHQNIGNIQYSVFENWDWALSIDTKYAYIRTITIKNKIRRYNTRHSSQHSLVRTGSLHCSFEALHVHYVRISERLLYM